MRLLTLGFLLSALTSGTFAKDDCISNNLPFQACAPIGAYYPPPTIDKSSEPFKKLTSQFTKTFDDLTKNGGSDKYGPITPNTTSFSVVIFGGAESLRDDPVFFEYHYTSPEDQTSNANLTSDTKFPVGDVSMVFTVYAWLVKMGEQWETPITKYLPELAKVKGPLTVNWKDITIGSLAGQMSGLSRESFQKSFAKEAPYFLPDTTPVVSYAAFQLLIFAMQRNGGNDWSSILHRTLLQPLNMSDSGVLSHDVEDIFAMKSLNSSVIGEPGALSFVSSAKDLARAGHSILASDLLSPAVTRRWLHPNVDTSNLRNGVGRPWEVYHAGNAISPILDALTKSGTIGRYASYFGLTTDFNAGFAILAHDNSVEDRKLDLNVHADIVSEVLGYLQVIAAKELEARYAGSYSGKATDAAFNTTDNGRGLEVQKLVIGGVNIKKQTAQKLGIHADDLDFRVYPTNVQDGSRHQFITVFQDKSAPIDMGTPTCITWQEIGADAEISFVFTMGRDGEVVGVEVPQLQAKMERAT
ncbi:beta-lactamase/transpeptidase-like protein [Fusarium sp. MPI-SDFR-AT-0072]|nr:beta-lactamase/transpeptidase-like protein [Fusarium sp. MPI-SDFR-AT-0072]